MTQKLLIDWPLTPFTGWGNYGIQLAQALAESELARPVLTSYADRSTHCELPWLRKLDELERFSKSLIEHSCNYPTAVVETNCQVVMEPMGNAVPAMRMRGKHQVGVTFLNEPAWMIATALILNALDWSSQGRPGTNGCSRKLASTAAY